MLAPKNYPQRMALMGAAQSAQIDQNQIAKFLWLVDGRPDLKHISDVVNNLLDALELANGIWPSILVDAQIDWLPGLLAELKNLLKTTSLSPRDGSSGTPPDAPLQLNENIDFLVRNALYAALCKSRGDGDALQVPYNLLQAHYALAHFEAMRTNPNTTMQLYEEYGESAEWPAIKPSPRHAGLAVRNLAENILWANDILQRMQLTLPPREFAVTEPSGIRFFNRTKRKDGTKRPKSWTENRVEYISDYIGQAYGLKARQRGLGSAPGRYIISMGDADDEAYDLGELTDLDEGSGDEPGGEEQSRQEEQLAADNCPGEDEDEAEGGTLGWTPGNDPAFEQSPGSFHGCLRTVTHHVIRETKSFAFGYEHLAALELRGLHPSDDYFFDTLSRLSLMPKSKREEVKGWRLILKFFRGFDLSVLDDLALETRILLVTMLWTGSSIERAHSQMWVDHLPDEPCSDMEILERGWSSAASVIRVKVPFPRYRQLQTPAHGVDCQREQYLVLPDAQNLCFLIDMFMKWRGVKCGPAKVFNKELSEYRASAAKLLKALEPTGRLTLSKIAGTLYGRIMARTGKDVVAAAMITGQVRRGARVPIFYACRSQQRLQEIYQDAVNSLREDIENAVFPEAEH